VAWLRLARSESIGAVTFNHLIARYGAATEALKSLPDLARRGGRPTPLDIPTEAVIAAELQAGTAIGARLIPAWDPQFPRLLAVLDTPPPVIWVLGDADLLARQCVAIVGARSASAAGQRFARSLASDLGDAGFCVVSGMARGIDAAAHEGSLATGSVAVLAGGVDDVYPAENARLYERLKQAGCLVSERPPGFKARAADFPRRNRLISGLALGVVVVEAELRSGSLITARIAGEQGREVFAVPGSPSDPRSRGANDLIRNGAVLVEGVDDILPLLDNRSRATPATATHSLASVPPDEAFASSLIELVSPAPTSIDDLARMAGQPIAHVLATLTELALVGRIEMLPGNMVVLIYPQSS
jgi:DNA processing protein